MTCVVFDAEHAGLDDVNSKRLEFPASTFDNWRGYVEEGLLRLFGNRHAIGSGDRSKVVPDPPQRGNSDDPWKELSHRGHHTSFAAAIKAKTKTAHSNTRCDMTLTTRHPSHTPI